MGRKRPKRMYSVEDDMQIGVPSKVKGLKAVLDNAVVKQAPLHKQIKGANFVEQFAKAIAQGKIQKADKVKIIDTLDTYMGIYSPIVNFAGGIYLIQTFPFEIAGGAKKSQINFFNKKLETTLDRVNSIIDEEATIAYRQSLNDPSFKSSYLNAQHLQGNIIMCPFDANPERTVRNLIQKQHPNTKFVKLYNLSQLKHKY